MLHPAARAASALGAVRLSRAALRGRLKPLPKLFPEEERSKQPSAFSILRALIGEFRSEQDSRLALVGAFGYDLLFQFDPIDLKLPRHGQGPAALSVRRHLLHGSQEGADRALSLRL
jgi:anthranilate synthase